MSNAPTTPATARAQLESMLVTIAEEGWPTARKSVAIVMEELLPTIIEPDEALVERVARWAYNLCVDEDEWEHIDLRERENWLASTRRILAAPPEGHPDV